MQVTLDLPEDLASYFGEDSRAVSRTATEALAVEGVRSGKLTAGQASRLLGFHTRDEIDGFLKAHGVNLPLTIEQVRRESETALRFSR